MTQPNSKLFQVSCLNRNIRFIAVCLIALLSLPACTYLKFSSIQAEYSEIQNSDPSQRNLKHMLDRETFFVFGKTMGESRKYDNSPIAVAAYSDAFKQNERVDTMFSNGTGTHYGLNLPEGNYDLLVFADIDRNRQFDQSEVIGKRVITLSKSNYPDRVASGVDIELTDSPSTEGIDSIPVPELIEIRQSLYYPTGTIRSLDDPLFDEHIATLGMYDPASFLEHAPTMFYALDEDVMHKIPVVFVHGIEGSSRSFGPIIKQLDLDRYRPWFFYYPSGGDLEQLSDFFYGLFLSGDIISLGDMPMIVVAHSMGGLVVREAFNKYKGNAKENKVELFVSIASPLGGHPSAAYGEKHGLIVLPAWRDLNPESKFIKKLYRKPLPEFMKHHLFYAYKNSKTLKLGENSDGVVPLSSQLHPPAQIQSDQSFGFNRGHVNILKSRKMIALLVETMAQVKSIFPEQSMEILAEGGFDIKLSDSYSPTTQHLIGYAGKYLVLLAHGLIDPIMPQQEQFIRAVQEGTPATTDIEREFIMFMKEFPDEIKRVLENWQA
jgi:pimeloyl-ACP methyl ester carboxylesterase